MMRAVEEDGALDRRFLREPMSAAGASIPGLVPVTVMRFMDAFMLALGMKRQNAVYNISMCFKLSGLVTCIVVLSPATWTYPQEKADQATSSSDPNLRTHHLVCVQALHVEVIQKLAVSPHFEANRVGTEGLRVPRATASPIRSGP
jgi:hypothetical protein